jgi:hypothetical protein
MVWRLIDEMNILFRIMDRTENIPELSIFSLGYFTESFVVSVAYLLMRAYSDLVKIASSKEDNPKLL